MGSPAPCLVFVVALVVMVVVVSASSPSKHHKHHGKGHHHHGKASTRAPRTRREQGSPLKQTTGSPLDGGIPGTEPTTEVSLPPCTGAGAGECEGLTNSECDVVQGVCECLKTHPVLDLENSYCGKVAMLTQPCEYSSECKESNEYSVCTKKKVCDCGPGYVLDELPEFGFNCILKNKSGGPGRVDPAMIGVLAGLALMFIIICVVLRLFSKARFRENRSIFNTPNPRLMNASLFKDSGRRGSAMSAVSATGSNHGTTAPAPKSPSPARETKKAETTVAIETVD